MTSDGTNTYSWDRAGRLLGMGVSSYAYNGLGQRVQQTVSGVVTDYLLDTQPGLAKVIAATTGANTERFVHERGLLSQQDSNGDWQWMVTDGLGSVRGVVDGAGFDPAYSVRYTPYGQPWSEQGTEQTPFGFTGEPTDDNGLVHLRARYYNPALGVFPSLDSMEGALQQAMSLNRYAYVAGNVVNAVDLSGAQPTSTNCPDERFAIKLLLTEGLAIQNNPSLDPRFQQYKCLNPGRYPFGCDGLNQPVAYTVVQSFGRSPYQAGACRYWDNQDDYSCTQSVRHCGVDMVSYFDEGWLWEIDEDGVTPISIGGVDDTYNWNTGETTSGNCVTVQDILNGTVKFLYRGATDTIVSQDHLGGRKVFAISDGIANGYNYYTLRVTLATPSEEELQPIEGLQGSYLEIQYTHLIACDGQDPGNLVGTDIRQGQLLGCYSKEGFTNDPHLHITYKQVRDERGNSFSPANWLCDYGYLNPHDPFVPNPQQQGEDLYGFGDYGLWEPPTMDQFPAHIVQFGLRPQGTYEWGRYDN